MTVCSPMRGGGYRLIDCADYALLLRGNNGANSEAPMGMYMVLKTASDTTIQRLLADPESIEPFLFPEEPDADD